VSPVCLSEMISMGQDRGWQRQMDLHGGSVFNLQFQGEFSVLIILNPPGQELPPLLHVFYFPALLLVSWFSCFGCFYVTFPLGPLHFPFSSYPLCYSNLINSQGLRHQLYLAQTLYLLAEGVWGTHQVSSYLSRVKNAKGNLICLSHKNKVTISGQLKIRPFLVLLRRLPEPLCKQDLDGDSKQQTPMLVWELKVVSKCGNIKAPTKSGATRLKKLSSPAKCQWLSYVTSQL
jgi:hypothetical protein